MLRLLFGYFKKPVYFTLISVCLILLISDYHFRWKNDKWKTTINSDAYDYYRYLPMVFIDHHFQEKKSDTGEPVPIKHYIGTAIFLLPFFTLAYFFSFIFQFPLDGYSVLFQVSVSIGTLFYLLYGLYYLYKLLKLYLISDWIISMVMLTCVFATNVFYYTVIAPGWSHIIAFALISFILFYMRSFFISFKRQHLLYVTFAVSFLFFTRPTDSVVLLLLPFLAGNEKELWSTFRQWIKEWKIWLWGFIVALIPLFCQLALYKLQTGHFIVWSYGGEGRFNFLKPEIINVLFSYAKGFFVYAPVCFLSLGGLWFLWKRNAFQFWGIVLFVFLNIYLISSWWCWNYGYSYGQRAFIDIYPVFFLLLAILLNDLKIKLFRVLILLLLVFFSILSCIQVYQCEKWILDMDFKTDKKGFWSVFLKTDGGYSGKYYRYPVDSTNGNLIRTTMYFNDMEKPDSLWNNPNTLTTEVSYSGKFASRVNKNSAYSAGLIKKISEVPYHRNVLIRVTGWFYLPEKGSQAYFAISFSNDWKSFNFNPFGMDAYVSDYGKWEQHVFEMYMPKLRENKNKLMEDQIEFYLFNNSSMDCYVDDLKIEFIEFKKLDRVLDIWWDY